MGKIRTLLDGWCRWLLDRLNDVGALLLWVVLNTPALPPELLLLLPAPVKLVLPAIWWGLVKWAAARKAQEAANAAR